ncbi:MAG: primosomal protein N', partial [Gammaproteobacteria bacterium]|nr:primosomal protein N' [Gammaproteobacteria bacterium]
APQSKPVHGPNLNAAQQDAVEKILAQQDGFSAYLLDGVTGSGKTEVYLNVIEKLLLQNKQALVLVPEIGLTPQLVARFRDRLGAAVAVYHSGLTDNERLETWLAAREGSARIIIGTRSAVFLPLKNPGAIFIDEEHDTSFKQQEGFRYSARDLAVVRAQRSKIPIVLGSATPSFESIENVTQDRYRHLHLPERAGDAQHPHIHLLDVRSRPMPGGISDILLDHIRRHLDTKGQVLLFLNRRGFAPTLICHSCGWTAECRRCDARLTYHKAKAKLNCHHCGAIQTVPNTCPECEKGGLDIIGSGTERLDDYLQETFPGVGIARIDRDNTQRKGSLDKLFKEIHSGERRILVGTQMLAKGHHFPDVTLVGIINADQGLFGVDFRSTERMAQLILQVSGRAGRAERPGEVYIQTHHPEHPLLQQLVREGYDAFAKAGLTERRAAGLPPFGRLVLLRAEASQREPAEEFLYAARELAERLQVSGVNVLGPAPAPMEKRAGRYRMQLLLQSEQRAPLHEMLRQLIPVIEELKEARRIRWSLDVDPIELL